MKTFLTLSKISAAVLLLLLGACDSDESKDTGSLIFEFTAKAEDKLLVFGSKKYTTPLQQSITIERLDFYLSNIQVKDAKSDAYYSEPDSYRLLSFDQDQATVTFMVENIPADFEISEIKMAIGVDSEANTSIDHVGDLDPTNGMAWDWNTGYKFLSLEGRYFDGINELGQEIKMHIGTDKNYAPVSLTFDEPFKIVGVFTLVYAVDALAPFGTVDLEEGTVFMNDERGDQVAQDYRNHLLLIEETFGFVK
ncbi:MbnP family protein [Reichenbachiella sp.]